MTTPNQTAPRKAVNWGVVLPIVFAVIGGAWALFERIIPPPPPPPPEMTEVTYQVCTVRPPNCPQGSMKIYPETDVMKWAQHHCAKSEVKKLPPGTTGHVITTEVKCVRAVNR